MSKTDKRITLSCPRGGWQLSKDEGVITGVAIITKGEALGHGVWIDDKFLSDVVEAGNALARGVKVRLGHPSFGADAIGSYLGRIKDFRLDGDTVRGDLILSKAAKISPRGSLFDYVLAMAEEAPDMFGLSIAFDSSGTYTTEDEPDKDYIVLDKLYAVDLVDEPAANPAGLFEARVASEEIVNNKGVTEMNASEMRKWIEAFGAEKALEYFDAGMSFEDAQDAAAEEKKLGELEDLQAALAEKDAMVKELEAKVAEQAAKIAELEAAMAEADKGAEAVPSEDLSAAEAKVDFEAIVKSHIEKGLGKIDAISAAIKARPDLHKEWLLGSKKHSNKVI